LVGLALFLALLATPIFMLVMLYLAGTDPLNRIVQEQTPAMLGIPWAGGAALIVVLLFKPVSGGVPVNPQMILVAGPYRSGTNDDPALIEKNVRAMTEASLRLFRAGHLPVMGEWYALPLITLAFSLLKYAGAACLICLGVITLLSNAPHGSFPTVAGTGSIGAFRDGVLVEMVNVKTALFFLAFIPQFVTATGPAGPRFVPQAKKP
jgi:hypothetical protein